MNKRRNFIKICLEAIAGLGLSSGALFSLARWAHAEDKRKLWPTGTKRESLIHRDPALVDASNLAITPLRKFRTMGTSDHEVTLDEWRLKVSGRIGTPLRLTYREVLALPSMERKVLLICPGFFTNHGLWKGISMKALIEKAGLGNDASHVMFSGPKGSYQKEERFPIKDLLANKVFLAYGVNGQTLPKKHGFPLRVVADGYYGDDWVKYVYKITLEKI